MNIIITADFIRGFIVGEGYFGFTTRTNKLLNKRVRIPTFTLKMHVRDKPLLIAVRDKLGLNVKVYEYIHQRRHYALLIVRNIGDIKDIIIPFFYNKLAGYKEIQFNQWLEKFNELDIAESYRFIYGLYKSGYYDRTNDKKKF